MSAGHQKFTWAQYIDFAEALFQEIPEGEDDECKARCGISRAYYGAYHGAAAYLRRIHKDFDVNGKGSHENLIQAFEELGEDNRNFRLVSQKLSTLKKLRKKADYDDVFFGINEFPQVGKLRLKFKIVIDDANRILKTIKEIEEKDESEK